MEKTPVEEAEKQPIKSEDKAIKKEQQAKNAIVNHHYKLSVINVLFQLIFF